MGIPTRPRYYRLSSISHATRLGVGLPPGAIMSVEREAHAVVSMAPDVGGVIHRARLS
jgi:hypothetical protein